MVLNAVLDVDVKRKSMIEGNICKEYSLVLGKLIKLVEIQLNNSTC